MSASSQEEMRLSPRLNQHASGVVLGVTQIINGLYNPVIITIIIIFFIHGDRIHRNHDQRLVWTMSCTLNRAVGAKITFNGSRSNSASLTIIGHY